MFKQDAASYLFVDTRPCKFNANEFENLVKSLPVLSILTQFFWNAQKTPMYIPNGQIHLYPKRNLVSYLIFGRRFVAFFTLATLKP